MFDLRLVMIGDDQSEPVAFAPGTEPHAILVARPYWDSWAKLRDQIVYRDILLDSGAFTYSSRENHPSATVDSYLEFVETRGLREDPSIAGFVNLDVIGNAEASLRQWHELRARGLATMPVFHQRSPWEILEEYVRAHDGIIGLGNLVGSSKRDEWRFLDGVFGRFPYRPFHLFGRTGRRTLLRYPLRSADSSSWAAPFRWGVWSRLSYGSPPVTTRGLPKTMTCGLLRAEMLHWQRLEEEVRAKWAGMEHRL